MASSEEVKMDSEVKTSQMDLEKSKNYEEIEVEVMKKKKKKKKKRRNLFFIIPRFGCMKLDDDNEFPAGDDGSFNMQAVDRTPTHLVVMVNGIIGSAENWRYAAKKFVKAYPRDVIVHCSESNSSTLTFDGVDVMGKRLADEVLSVVQRHPNLQKISFIGHSLGGLIARYAIAVLYKPDVSREVSEENGDCKVNGSKESFSIDKSRGRDREVSEENGDCKVNGSKESFSIDKSRGREVSEENGNCKVDGSKESFAEDKLRGREVSGENGDCKVDGSKESFSKDKSRGREISEENGDFKVDGSKESFAEDKLRGREASEENGDCKVDGSKESSEDKLRGKIAGLEPINFITSASPHLGSRGHKQVPLFCGLYALEKFASRTSWLLGRTGKHLMLVDNDDGKPPLLLRMASDSGELKFVSALQSFKRRVVYANVRFDHLVGWSTSSLRRRNELPKRRNLLKHEKYPHIVNEERARTTTPQEDSSEVSISGLSISDMEEAMLRSLTKMSWERIDVNFSGSAQRFFAHNTIQVQTYCTNSDGADVIRHTIDNFLL